MTHAYFFGYGSLVNRLTHDHSPVLPAQARGWRRAWRAVPERDLCYLTVIPDPHCVIDGLMAPVPKGSWAELDKREEAYERLSGDGHISHGSEADQIAIYAISPARLSPPGPDNAIRLSYLDVVIDGYLREFGPRGAAQFFDTTTGWEAPVHNDRDNPRYTRSVPVSQAAFDCVDAALARFGSRKI